VGGVGLRQLGSFVAVFGECAEVWYYESAPLSTVSARQWRKIRVRDKIGPIVRQFPTVEVEQLADITGVHEPAKRLMAERTELQRWRHDLKNQLGIVLGFSELLLGELEDGSRFRPDVAEIQKAASRALDLIGQMPVGTDKDEKSRT
jgi:signal transduction histidine kinase